MSVAEGERPPERLAWQQAKVVAVVEETPEVKSFVLKPDAKPEERPWFQYRITPERAVWRDSSAMPGGRGRSRCARRNTPNDRNMKYA